MKTSKLNPEMPLYDLPDRELDQMGGEIHEAVKAAGYDVSPRNLINSWNCWRATVADFKAALADAQEVEI